ncbi:MAG TPA: acetate kinase [Polyangiales bacterium]|nr:acetate kinase [Polyangiales bacterium]
MSAHVLVINCGSSSIKLALLEPKSGETTWHALGERLGTSDARLVVTGKDAKGAKDQKPRTIALSGAGHEAALDAALKELPEVPLAGVGHRVVHGGEAFTESVVLDDATIKAIDAVSDLAPLHNPANLIGIRAALKRLPELGQVAVFDTAFHHSLPPQAYTYAVPYELYEKYKVRKYGFHGTSHRYVSERAAELLGRPLASLNLVTAHLGNGASAAAIRGGKSVDTTMGLTPLEGLVMGTRSGDVDPNLHQFLVEHAGMTLEQVTDLLNKQSGLLGLSGASNDMRNLLQLEAAGNPRAKLAIDVFCYRLAKAVLGLCAALPSLDALVFTGGIGENAAPVRSRAVESLAVLGLRLDPERNQQHGRKTGGIVSDASSPISVMVVPTNEELVIAREAVRLLHP